MTTKKNIQSKSSVKHKVLHLALGATLVGTSFVTPLGNGVSAAEQNQDIKVSTEWLGAGNGEGVDFDVHLYSNKATASVGSANLNEDNQWSHIFENMPTVIPAADEDGTAENITYTLKSTPLKDYYSVVTGNQNIGFTVLNMLKEEGEIQGQIVVRYVDERGREIAYRTIQSGRVNSDYAEIMPKEIKGYKFKEVTRGETTGTYEYGISIVEFTYEEAEPQEVVEGAIQVYHVDRYGNEIALRDMISGEVDAEYSIKPKEITGYTLVTDFEIDEEEMDDPRHEFYLKNSDLVFGGEITGQYEEGIHKVYFMYDVAEDFNADAPVRGGVIVKFQDTDGNEIAERYVQFGLTDGYDKDGKYIPAERFDVGINWMENYIKSYLGAPEADSIRDLGYGVIGVDGYTTGPYVPGFTEIIYTFDVIKDDPGYENYNDVIVQYMDEYGNEIAVRDRVFAKIGSDYSVNEKKIKGYTFERVIGEPEGKISDQTIVVQFIYSKDDEEEVVINGDVVVKHVNTAGEEIAERDSYRGKLGEAYETEAKDIEGYEFVEVRGEANGVFGEGVRTIEYVYQLVEDGNDDGNNNNNDQNGNDDDNGNDDGNNNNDDVNNNDGNNDGNNNNGNNNNNDDQNGNDDDNGNDDGNNNNDDDQNGNDDDNGNDDGNNDGNNDDGNNNNDDQNGNDDVNNNDGNNDGNNDDGNNDDGNNNNGNNNNGNNDDGNDNDNGNNNSNGAPTATTNGNNNGGNGSTNAGNNTNGSTNKVGTTVSPTQDNGMQLPNTATNTFNLMALGASLLALATGGLFFANRRRKDTAEDVE